MNTGPTDHPILELIQPIERKPGHLLAKDIVDRCLEPGLEREHLSNQMRQFAKRNYLAPLGVDANDGRNPYLYAEDSALIAKVLSVLAFSSLDIHAGDDGPACIGRTVSNALKFHGSARDAKFGRNPAARVLLDWQRGVEGWSLHLRWMIDDTGQKRVAARLWNVPHGIMPPFMPDPEPLPHAEMVISLDRVLPIITADRAGMN